jgi:hypothetical protein
VARVLKKEGIRHRFTLSGPHGAPHLKSGAMGYAV